MAIASSCIGIGFELCMNQRKAVILIDALWAGLTVIDLLERRFTYLDRPAWAAEISNGRIRVNGGPTFPDARISEGDRLEYLPSDTDEPPVETGYRKVYEDAHLLVVDKPANLPCHPGGRYFRHTLWALLQRREGLDVIHFVHRLDRETSGLVLVAKSPQAAKRCGARFSSGAVRKRYLALVEGRFPMGEIDARGYLVRDFQSLVRKKRRFYPDGECPSGPTAETCRTLLRGTASKDGLTLVEAVPETGRLHQIRATLSGMGYPVVGDKIYGPDDALFIRFIEDRLSDEDRRRLRLHRQALHAAGLSIRHPFSNVALSLDAPLPPDMASLIG